MKPGNAAKGSERKPNLKKGGRRMKRKDSGSNKVVVVGLARKDGRQMLSQYKANGGQSERLISDIEALVRGYEIEIADSLEEPDVIEEPKPAKPKGNTKTGSAGAIGGEKGGTDKGAEKTTDKGTDKGATKG